MVVVLDLVYIEKIKEKYIKLFGHYLFTDVSLYRINVKVISLEST